ncbi:MAG: hypothetical protein RSD76_07920, partial [Clostridia bacterium]
LMSDISQRLIMLKPMQNGVSGYARLESRSGQTQLQINARGLRTAALRAFWYSGGGEVRELGTAHVNPRGEAAITAEAPRAVFAPERLQALLLVAGGDEPSPQMIGLCVQQSAGSLMDAKNAILALCEKLSRGAREQKLALCEAEKKEEEARQAAPLHGRAHAPQGDEGARAGAAETQAQGRTGANGVGRHGRAGLNAEADMMPLAPTRERVGRLREQGEMPRLPREVFLPALDPLPYVQASEPALPTVAAGALLPVDVGAGAMPPVNGAGAGAYAMPPVNGAGAYAGACAMPSVNGSGAGMYAGAMPPTNGACAGASAGAMPPVNGSGACAGASAGAMPPVNGSGAGAGAYVCAMPPINGACAGAMPPVNGACAGAGAMPSVNGSGAGAGAGANVYAMPPINGAYASAMPPVNGAGAYADACAMPSVNGSGVGVYAGAMPPINGVGTPTAAIPASYHCHL